ncbi:L,D-transpeptidase family protein [Gynuella sp.]|uniref:L,D-transpeptidase family protein n=1 Tax=Gynuella sp. TaxID=2969146 RepID=UPI003D110503
MLRFFVFILTILIGLPAWAEATLVKVDKSEQRMTLFEGDQIIASYHIALGGNPKGHKQQEGDEKTPEGNYVLDYLKEDSAYHKAMHISYPNQTDQRNAKARGVSPGGFIMIHGQRNGLGWLSGIVQRFNWTDGCIALTNKEMDEFVALVPIGTPIRIDW